MYVSEKKHYYIFLCRAYTYLFSMSVSLAIDPRVKGILKQIFESIWLM